MQTKSTITERLPRAVKVLMPLLLVAGFLTVAAGVSSAASNDGTWEPGELNVDIQDQLNPDRSVDSYGGGQDGACGGAVAIVDASTLDDHAAVSITGNCWKKVAVGTTTGDYTVTANTILEVDFSSTSEAEIQGVGFDTDDNIANPIRIFQFFGTQAYGPLQTFNTYAGSGTTTYVIPVGNYITGTFTHLTLVNDDDAAPIGNSVFGNIKLYEGTPPPTPQLDVNGALYSIETYGGGQDSGCPAGAEILDGNATLKLTGNCWKKAVIAYDVTPATVLSFDFSSTSQGEIQGIGFDTDENIANPIQIFQLYGTQSYGNLDFATYSPSAPAVVHYEIPVGTYFTGAGMSLTFINDHDVSAPTAESVFSNIVITEGSAQTIALYAFNGATALPGLVGTTPVLGYTDGSAATAPGGPVIETTVGTTLTIELHNELAETTGLWISGQPMIPDLEGVAAGGGVKEYTFLATSPGTYLYEAAPLLYEAGVGVGRQHQSAMGLYGMLVVRPAGAPFQVYDDATTAFSEDAEAFLLLSELDVELNTTGAGFDMRNYHPEFLLINGAAHPDTGDLLDLDVSGASQTVLLRYANAGQTHHSMSVLGARQTLVGLDGSELTNHRHMVAESFGPGQTADSLVTVPLTTPAGTKFPLYDAAMMLHNGTIGEAGGMLTFLNVTDGGTLPAVGPTVTLDPSGLGAGDLGATTSSAADEVEYFIVGATTITAPTLMGGSGTTWSASGVTIPDGALRIYARAYLGGVPGPVGFIDLDGGDHVAPAVIWPSVSGILDDPAHVRVQFTGDDSATGGSNITEGEYTVDAGTPTTTAPNFADGIAAFEVIVPAGSTSVSVRVMDEAGNWSIPLLIPIVAP